MDFEKRAYELHCVVFWEFWNKHFKCDDVYDINGFRTKRLLRRFI